MITFDTDPADQAIADRTRSFIADAVIAHEADRRWTIHGPSEELRSDLTAIAREAGLLSPHVATRWGGRGLSHRGRALVFEEAGYSLLGPIAMNIAAPDEGNAHLLESVATPAQKEQWLAPLARAEIRTAFAMSEPPPGAGSDPSALQTTATADGGGYRVDGRKWLITGARGASLFIVMAADASAGGATMLLVPADTPGIEFERDLPILDSSFTGGHSVIRFNDVRVPADAVLGQPGRGFANAQVRLAPARLTHCMRWLGAARRAHDTALAYATERRAFGRVLADHEGVGFALADNEIDLRTARLHTWYTAWLLDSGERASMESSIAKTVCSEALWRVVDRSLQLIGGIGLSDDTPVARIHRDIRAFRIYDGPSEVHRYSIARTVTGASGRRT